jgi:hypothetical protein
MAQNGSYANKAFIDMAMSQFLSFNNSAVTIAVNKFLNTRNETDYNSMLAALNAAQDNLITIYSVLGGSGRTSYKLRFLISSDDGTVVADSSRSTTDNTFAKFNAKAVNTDNHHTRPEMLVALLSNSGVGYSERYSSTVSANLVYLASRIGTSTSVNDGTIRLSIVKD